MWSLRHCERSEAIQRAVPRALDCFGALRAPRNDGFRLAMMGQFKRGKRVTWPLTRPDDGAARVYPAADVAAILTTLSSLAIAIAFSFLGTTLLDTITAIVGIARRVG